ncbi:MAG TPA: hypothetical protein DCO72_10020 [Ruminococcus sp.]|nr:hypothetical protein [Ruminococcus sp.]
MKKKWIASMLALALCAQVSAIPVKAEPVPDGVEIEDNFPWGCEVIMGDLDMSGKLDELDISILQSYLHKKIHLTKEQNFVADYNFDGVINVVDLCMIKKAVLESKTTYKNYTFTSPDELYKTVFNVKTYANGRSIINITWYDPDGDSEQVSEFSTVDLNPFEDETNYHLNWGENTLTVEYKNSVADLDNDGFNVVKFDYPDRTLKQQTYSREIKSSSYPEIIQVDVTANCYNEIRYKVNVSISGEIIYDYPSKVGEKISITTDKSISDYHVTFHYNESELRWIPENNLIIVYKNAVIPSEIDTENNTISFDAVGGDGTYTMVDAYEWYRSKGQSTEGYQYEKGDFTNYISDWERAGKTGDIMKLVNKDWVLSCGKEFHVSNAEQLAGFVYYCNACDLPELQKRYVKLILEENIDLSGYEWAQIDDFYGEINGNGHTISNMKISGAYAGMIKNGYHSNIHDINIENADISGTRGAVIMGYAMSKTCKFTNLHVSGNIKSNNVDCGAIVAYQNSGCASFDNCSADVTLNGEPLPFLSREQYIAYHYLNDGTEELKITLDKLTITRGENPDFDKAKLSIVAVHDGKEILGEHGFKLTEKYIDDFRLSYVGEYQFFVTYPINGKQTRISNIVTFVMEDAEPVLY